MAEIGNADELKKLFFAGCVSSFLLGVGFIPTLTQLQTKFSENKKDLITCPNIKYKPEAKLKDTADYNLLDRLFIK